MCWHLSGEWGYRSTAQRHDTKPNYRTRSECGQPERKFQEAEITQRKWYTVVISTRWKEINVLHKEKHALRVEKPTILQQSVLRFHPNLRRSILRSLIARNWTSSMTTQSLLILQKKRSCLCLWTTPLMLWIQCMSKFKNKSFAQMEIANELVKMQVDSEASCNLLPL